MKHLVSFLAAITAALMGAFTLSTLWAWFLVPAGFPVLSVFSAYGLMLLGTTFITVPIVLGGEFNRQRNEGTNIEGYISSGVMVFIYLVVLFAGWIISALFG